MPKYEKLIALNYDTGEVIRLTRSDPISAFLDFIDDCNYIQVSHYSKGVLYIIMDKIISR